MTNEQLDRGIAEVRKLVGETHLPIYPEDLWVIFEEMKEPEGDPVEEIRKMNGPMSLQNLSDKCTGCIEGCCNCIIGKCGDDIPNLMEEPETETI